MKRYYWLAGLVLAALAIVTKWCERGGSVAVYAGIAAGLAVMMLVLAWKIDTAIRHSYKVQRDERLRKMQRDQIAKALCATKDGKRYQQPGARRIGIGKAACGAGTP